jgi:hypothetical protein
LPRAEDLCFSINPAHVTAPKKHTVFRLGGLEPGAFAQECTM